jgi:excisionase family DNA binding protein
MNILNTRQVAELLGVKQQKVYQLIKSENLPHIKFGRMYRFFESSILEWKAECDRIESERPSFMKAQIIASHLRCSTSTVYNLAKKEGLSWSCVNKDKLNIWLMSKERNRPAQKEQPIATEKEQKVAMPVDIAA